MIRPCFLERPRFRFYDGEFFIIEEETYETVF